MNFNDARSAILAETAEALNGMDGDQAARFCELIAGAPRIFVTGEGRSGLMARAFAMRLMHVGCIAFVVGETTTPSIGKGDLLVAVSGSGETAITRHVLTQAATAGANTALLSSRADSSTGQAATFVLVVPGATKRRQEGELSSQQPLGSLFDQAAHLALDAIILLLTANQGVPNAPAPAARHSNLE